MKEGRKEGRKRKGHEREREQREGGAKESEFFFVFFIYI